MRASTPMTRDVIVVPPELPLAEAWAIMRRERIRHLPVVGGGKLLGIVSDRDILIRAKLLESGEIVVEPQLLVGTAMTPAPFVCGMSTPVEEVVHVMTEKKIDAVPVVSADDELVGLVTSTDLMLLLLTGQTAHPLPFEFQVREEPAPSSV
jgi:acetoin utilization protein AcuB